MMKHLASAVIFCNLWPCGFHKVLCVVSCRSYAELLSELRALPAGYPRTRNQRRAKSSAISANKPRLVNLFSDKRRPGGGVCRYQPAV
jgi:hypothetical protein